MRVQWVLLLVTVVGLLATSVPVSACIPGAPAVEFEAQAMSSGSAFPDLTILSPSLVEELFPRSMVFGDDLYTVWQKENFTDSVKYFLTLRSFDGSGWSDTIYPSCQDMEVPERSELNLNPRLGADEDALYMTWTSNEPNWTTGVDDDVVFRFTEDGDDWSEVIEISGHYNDGLDKLPVVQPLKGRTWFLWESNDRLDTDGADMDIVMRPWDGKEFGQTIEVTPTGDTYNDQYVQVDSDGERMYVMWMKANYSSGMANVNDIWVRVFDGSSWVIPPTRISSDAVANNEHPTVVAADGRAFFLWETQDTGKIGDLSAIIMREWSPEEGFGPKITISSLSSNGKDTTPTGVWYHDQLVVAWITMDGGVTFGDDADLVYRVGSEDRFGQMRFGDFVEVSDPSDDFGDRYPQLVVYDDIVNAVWIVDVNYTQFLIDNNQTDVLEDLGGIYRSPDVCIQSIIVPFEKQLGLVYTLGTAFPIATKPTSARITVTDLDSEPLKDSRVSLRIEPKGGPSWKASVHQLEEVDDGVYSIEELEFPEEGTYDVSIIVQDVTAGSFSVDVVPPPPSFAGRVPLTALFFVIAGAVLGTMLFRMMGRDELVDEVRPAPLIARPDESY